MRALYNLMIMDAVLLLRNAFFWIITASLILIILTINYLIPCSELLEKTTIVSFGLPNLPSEIMLLESESHVFDYIVKNGGVGLVARDGSLKVLHGGLSDTAVHNLMLSTIGSSSQTEIPVEYLRQRVNPVPNNYRLLPIFICFEALIVGFLMGGILLLAEKEQHTLNAYRISPGTTLAYVVAKTVMLSICGTMYALAMAIFTIGFTFNWFTFLSLAFLSSLFFTLLGLLITVFFKNLNSWFLIAILILSLNMLSALGYSNPSFSNLWIHYHPIQ